MKSTRQIISTLILTIIIALGAKAQEVIQLYEGTAPCSENWDQKESEFTHSTIPGLLVRNVRFDHERAAREAEKYRRSYDCC